MPALAPFSPGDTVTLPVTTATDNVALAKLSNQVVVTNAPGGSMAFVKFGDDSVEALVDGSMPILPGAAYTFTIGPTATHMAAITETGTATVYASIGEGA